MSVGRAQVEAIARLAQLDVDAAEAERLAEEMSRILDHADRLRAMAVGADGADVASGADGRDGEGRADGAGIGTEAARSEGREDGGGSGIDPEGEKDPAGENPGPSTPDVLRREPTDFAPRFEEGFFVVPPPPGVTPAGPSDGEA